MSMSQQNNLTHNATQLSGPIETPCYAQCINLQSMHPQLRQRLGLQYKIYYTITRYELDPTKNHLGAWVQLAGVGSTNNLGEWEPEWIPANFFFINLVIYPN